VLTPVGNDIPVVADSLNFFKEELINKFCVL